MKFTTSETVSINGTSLMDEVRTTRREIESVFGAPTFEGQSDKTTTEWWIEFEDGLVATIYDWKRYGMGAPGMDELEDWHIGGRGYEAAGRVVSLLS